MPFIKDILSHRSVSIVGIEKNTGKTETLNYVLNRLKTMDTSIALTSIGVDGEQTDRVTSTAKPEITIFEKMLFVTSEKHYFQRHLVSEIMDISDNRTALGRLVTAKAKIQGKCIISGPSDTAGMKKLIEQMKNLHVHTTLVDGALSRLSLASPAVTDAMILATGAAYSANIPQLVRKTKYIQRLIELETVHTSLTKKLQKIKSGMWAIDEQNEMHDLQIPSVFLLDKRKKDIFRYGNRIYVAGAISDKLLQFLGLQNRQTELIIHDFTKVFASQKQFDMFLKKGNSVKSIMRNNLIAVTVNPLAPNGFCLNSETLQNEMKKALQIPVYDIRKIECN